MEHVTRESITSLLEAHDGTVVSIYTPTHRAQTPVTVREDQTRFKNLIHKAGESLDEKDKGIIKLLTDVLENPETWRRTAETLAVFATKQRVWTFVLPVECEEYVYVGDHFVVSPLLTLADYDQQYYLLALAVHEPKLFKGSAYGLQPVDIELPTSPEDELNIDEMFSNSNTVRSGSGSAGISTHGQGDSREAGNEERLKFFRIIDHTIASSDRVDATLPVLIAGTVSEVAEYRSLSNLSHVLEARMDGNYTKVALPDIHEKAWPLVVSEVYGARIRGILTRFDNLVGAQKTSTDMEDIAEAAAAGRIDTLLLNSMAVTQDTINDQQGFGAPIRKIIPSNMASVHKLVHDVLAQSGAVIGLTQDKIPGGAPVAALYRY